MNKFEKLIEYIINDEDQKARELFHDIVVEKSRDIYESIMDEESVEETVAGNQVENMVDEVSTEEAMGEDDEEGAELELGGDEEGFAGDDAGEEFGDEEGEAEEHAEIEDQVMSIDAKLDELLSKFDEIMGQEEGPAEAPAEEPAFGGEEPAMMEAEECDDEEEEEEEKEESKEKTEESRSAKTSSELMREYVEKIQDMNLTGASEGDAVGAAGKKVAVNTKDVNGPGANFGGTAVMAKGGEQNQDGTSAPASPKPQVNNAGNRNVPGGKADKLETTGKEYSKENGAEGQTTDGSVPVAKGSVQKQNTGKK